MFKKKTTPNKIILKWLSRYYIVHFIEWKKTKRQYKKEMLESS